MGAVNDTDTDVPVPSSVAVPIVGALAGPFADPATDVLIGYKIVDTTNTGTTSTFSGWTFNSTGT